MSTSSIITEGGGLVTHDNGAWLVDVDVFSPDASIRIRASRRGDLAVQVDGLDRHTEQTLAAQVGAAARMALAALRQISQPSPDSDPVSGGGRPGSARV